MGTLGRKAAGGSAILLSGEVLNSGAALLKNVILARILSKEDFGIAASLILMMSLFELTSKMAFGQQIIRARSDEVEDLQAAGHSCQLIAGLLGTVLILLLIYPLTAWFDVAAHRRGIVWISIIPLINGFGHLGIYAKMREMRFSGYVAASVSPQLAMTAAAWYVAQWTNDYRAVIWLLLGKAVLTMIGSHCFSSGTFKLSMDRSRLLGATRFSAPLLLSSYLVAAIFHGDRLIVAGMYSMAQLGSYAVAASLAITPGLIVLRAAGTIGTPILAQGRNSQRFEELYNSFTEGLVLAGFLFASAALHFGGLIVRVLYGPKFVDAVSILNWLAIAQALRVVRGGGIAAALVKGDSAASLYTNLYRVSAVAIALLVANARLPIAWVAGSAAVGEVLAMCMLAQRCKRRFGLSPKTMFRPTLIAAALLLFGLWCTDAFGGMKEWADATVRAVVVFSTSVALFIACSRLRGNVIAVFLRRPAA